MNYSKNPFFSVTCISLLALLPVKTTVSQDYRSDLTSILERELEQIDVATLEFINGSSRLDKKVNDSIFFPSYWTVYTDMVFKSFDYTDAAAKELLKDKNKFRAYGFEIKPPQNGLRINLVDSAFLVETIYPFLTNTMKVFINQNIKEFSLPDSDPTEVLQCAIFWESFCVQNPNFMLIETATYHYRQWHLKNLLLGTKDSPSYDENGRIKRIYLDTFLKLIKDFPSSKTALIVKELLVVLEANNYIYDDKTRALIASKLAL